MSLTHAIAGVFDDSRRGGPVEFIEVKARPGTMREPGKTACRAEVEGEGKMTDNDCWSYLQGCIRGRQE